MLRIQLKNQTLHKERSNHLTTTSQLEKQANLLNQKSNATSHIKIESIPKTNFEFTKPNQLNTLVSPKNIMINQPSEFTAPAFSPVAGKMATTSRANSNVKI
jgi:hypothetical protein